MKIALWQTSPHHDEFAALNALDQAACLARSNGAELMAAPEMTLGGYHIGLERCTDLAARANDLIDAVGKIAQRHEIALVVGLALPGPDRHPFNAAIAVDRMGTEICRYHKTHLYGDVDREQFSAGAELSPLFELNGWRISLAICYDMEFPEIARSLRLQGADVIVAPTANMVPFQTVPTRLIPARAEENAIYVVYSNYIGEEGDLTYCGLSCICGPDGNDLVRGTAHDAAVLFAELDKTALSQCRDTQTHAADRRPELYSALLKEGQSHE